MLRDEIALFTKLSGRDGEHTPIGVIGAYLDGYEKGCEQGKWIPVSERLPEKEGHYIVSTDYYDVTIDSFVDDCIVEFRRSLYKEDKNEDE